MAGKNFRHLIGLLLSISIILELELELDREKRQRFPLPSPSQPGQKFLTRCRAPLDFRTDFRRQHAAIPDAPSDHRNAGQAIAFLRLHATIRWFVDVKSPARTERLLHVVLLGFVHELATPTASSTHNYLLWLHHRNIARPRLPRIGLGLRELIGCAACDALMVQARMDRASLPTPDPSVLNILNQHHRLTVQWFISWIIPSQARQVTMIPECGGGFRLAGFPKTILAVTHGTV